MQRHRRPSNMDSTGFRLIFTSLPMEPGSSSKRTPGCRLLVLRPFKLGKGNPKDLIHEASFVSRGSQASECFDIGFLGKKAGNQ